MALRSGWRKLPWPGPARRRDDPYWDFFINTPPADPANSLLDVIRKAPEGNVFPTKADLHTPEITTSHVKEMARYLGADLVGITALDADDAGHPFAIVCAVRADDDPRQARGIGGQVPVQNGLFVTFVLSAWIRELGFRAQHGGGAGRGTTGRGGEAGHARSKREAGDRGVWRAGPRGGRDPYRSAPGARVARRPSRSGRAVRHHPPVHQ